MKAGQVLSTMEFPGLDDDQAEHLRSRLASLATTFPSTGSRCAPSWSATGRSAGAAPRPDRHGARGRSQHRPGLSGANARRPQGGDQGAVSGHRRGGRGRYAEFAPALAVAAATDARPGGARRPRGGARADRRGMRLRARGEQPPPARAVLARSSLHPGPRGRHGAEPTSDPGQRMGRRYHVREVARQPDPVRDRYMEIVYRFFYATAASLDLALGDPHPGNYLLGGDGRVAFFDFGMMRRLPAGYLRAEGDITRGVREGHAAAVVAGMRELGYCPATLARGMTSCSSGTCGMPPGGCTAKVRYGSRPRTCGAAPTCSARRRCVRRCGG